MILKLIFIGFVLYLFFKLIQLGLLKPFTDPLLRFFKFLDKERNKNLENIRIKKRNKKYFASLNDDEVY